MFIKGKPSLSRYLIIMLSVLINGTFNFDWPLPALQAKIPYAGICKQKLYFY